MTPQQRRRMVSAVRRGVSQRAVARRFGVPLSTVQHWVCRAQGRRLDRVDWTDRSRAPRHPHRTPVGLEQKVLDVRRWLKQYSALGEYGAPAIYGEIQRRCIPSCPSIATISRILQRHGVLDACRRIRRPPPPKGWYLPEVAARRVELDSFDTIEGLAIRGGPHLTVFTGISLHGGWVIAWPQRRLNAQDVVQRLLEYWRVNGLPAYAQFDNDQRFSGPRQYANTLGRVARLCLLLGVTPVFVPPNETGFQAAIESFNARWQSKVWSRFQHSSLYCLKRRSLRYLAAVRQRHAARIEASPARRPFPQRWSLNWQKPLRGIVIFLRRTDDRGRVNILGHSYQVSPNWVHRLVRAEVDLSQLVIRFYTLRRREPNDQPLLREVAYAFPHRPFKE